jgi:hypothetical protein
MFVNIRTKILWSNFTIGVYKQTSNGCITIQSNLVGMVFAKAGSNRRRCLEKSSVILVAFAIYVPRTLSQLTAFKDNITYSNLSLLGVYF